MMTTEQMPDAHAGGLDQPVVALPSHDAQGREMGWVRINGHRYWRPIVRVATVTVDGTTCAVPVSELIDILSDGGRYEVELTTMSRADFDRLPEFNGW